MYQDQSELDLEWRRKILAKQMEPGSWWLEMSAYCTRALQLNIINQADYKRRLARITQLANVVDAVIWVDEIIGDFGQNTKDNEWGKFINDQVYRIEANAMIK